MTRQMALELAPHRIRVNAIAPGLTDTAQPRYGMNEEEIAAGGRALPLGRIARAAGDCARRGVPRLRQRRLHHRPVPCTSTAAVTYPSTEPTSLFEGRRGYTRRHLDRSLYAREPRLRRKIVHRCAEDTERSCRFDDDENPLCKPRRPSIPPELFGSSIVERDASRSNLT